MKKSLLLALLLFAVSAAVAPAQTIKERPADGTQMTATEWQFQNLKYVDLLNRQNELLTNKTIAIWLTLGGSVLASVSASAIQAGSQDVGTQIAFMTSALATAVGSIWCFVNEFALISNQKKINNALTLRYGPDGIVLQF